MTEKTRVGVVGVGYLGSIHARIYARMPNVELVGVADIDPTTAKKVGADCNCDFYNIPEQLLDEVEAVSIVVPTTLHREVAELFIDNGVDILLEKPVAHSVADAEVIVDAAEKADVILQIGHLERFNAGVIALADMLDRPRFFEVHRLGTFVERATDVDVITDLMIHDIDIVLSLVDSPLERVTAVGTRVVTGHVDIANARLEFRDKTVANVTASRVSSKKFRRIRVFAESCYMALNFADQQLEIVRPKKINESDRFAAIVSEKIKIEQRPPLDAELEHFIECVRSRNKPLVGGRDGLEALKVADIVMRDIENT
ncbi:MAG: UDP-N-acetylglucosamine 3-dehydrogenase [marine bacterium B5-7]|nr:MAG: UDP-N-acetylglucosamine 3-dehydrogenase [marine bacterium B5-7]